MPASDHATTARAINDAYNARDWDAAMERVTPNAEIVNQATGQVSHGPEGMREFLQSWATAFPDSQVETTAVVADAASAAMEFRGRGTHTGPLAGPAGDIPPTGRSVDVPFVMYMEFDAGKIARGRLYFDLVTLLQQIGVQPGAAAASS